MNNDFEIRNGVLERYRGLAPSVDIPEGVTTIGKLAFFFCRKVWEVKLNDNIVAIDERAFANTKIRDMIFPDSISYVGNEIFRACNVDEITIFGEVFDLYEIHFMYDYDLIALNNGLDPDEICGVSEIAKFTAASEIPMLLFNGDYDNLDMPEDLRCEIIARVLRNKPVHKNFLNMVKEHIRDILRLVIREPEIIQYLIDNEVITSNNIDECISIANESNAYETQAILEKLK